MSTLCRRSSPLRNQARSITRHAPKAMISPTRIPFCLSVVARWFRFALVVMYTLATGDYLGCTYRTGSGSCWVTGGAFSGDLLGGSGLTGSAVGNTGSPRGMTVYLLT